MTMPKGIATLARSVAVFGGGTLAAQLVGTLLLPVYTRYLSPSDYGIVEMAAVTTSLSVALLVLGLDNALFRFWFDANSDTERRTVATTAFVVVACSGMVGLGGGLVAAPVLSRVLFGPTGHEAAVWFMAAAVFAAVASVVPRGLFRLRGQDGAFAILSASNALIAAAVSIAAVVVMNQGAVGLIGATAGSAIIMLLLMGIAQHKYITTGHVSGNLALTMLKFSLPVIPSGLALWALALSDRYFLRQFGTMTDVGLYAVGAKLASPAALLGAAFQLAWPQFAFSMMARRDAEAIYARVLTYFVAVAALLALVLTLYAPEILQLLTPAEFWPASSVVLPLAAGWGFYAVYYIFAIGFQIAKTMNRLPVITAIPALLNLGLNFALIPTWGMLGAAYATAGSYLAMAILAWRLGQGIYPVRYEWHRIGGIALISILVLVLSWIHTGASLLPPVLFKGLLLMTWGAAVWVAVLVPSERERLVRVLRRRSSP